MLTDSITAKLLSLLKFAGACGPEYTNSEKIHFINGSFEHYHMEYLIDSEHKKLSKIDNFFERIKQYKETGNIDDDFLKSSTLQMAGHLVFHFFPSSQKKYINSSMEPWYIYAEENNINVDIEWEQYQSILKNLDEFSFPNKCYKELNSVHEIIQKLVKNPEDIVVKKEWEDYLSDPSTVFNTSQYKNIIYNQLSQNVFENLLKIENCHNTILEKIEKNLPNVILYRNREFVNNYNNLPSSDIKEFMLEKMIPRHDKIFTLNPNGSYIKFIEFGDTYSLVFQKKDGKLVDITSFKQKNEVIGSILKEELYNVLNKKPFIAKLFVNKLSEDYNHLKLGIVAANTYLKNEDILKSNNFSLINTIKDSTFEELDDAMNACILNHKVKQYAHSITSSKYLHLYNEKTYKLFKEIYNMDIDASQLQKDIGKKIAAHKSPDEFNETLSSYLNLMNAFNVESIKLRANSQNCQMISEFDNILILKIDNFTQSKNLGSSSWCISRSSEYFSSYTENDASQYFIYDFNKDSTDNESMIGLTLNSDGTHSASHLKDDNQAERDDFLEKIQIRILLKNEHLFDVSDKRLISLINKEKELIDVNKKSLKIK